MVNIGRRTLMAVGASALLPAFAAAAGLPHKDITFLIPYAPGGGFDAYVRTAIPHMIDALPPGTRIIPVNLDGAGGAKAASQLYHAKPDGSMISVLNMPGALILQMLQGNAGYDLSRFSWIGNLGSDPYAVCVGMESPIKSMDDVMALSKKRVVKFPCTGPASMANAATLIANKLLGIRGQIISGYKGSNDYIIGTVRGDGDVAISSLTSMVGLAQAGIVRIIATFEDKSSLPGVPDAHALGQPELAQLVQYRPVAAPPGLPADVTTILADALTKALTNPEMVAWAKNNGANLEPATPEATKKMLAGQTEFINKWKDVLSAPA